MGDAAMFFLVVLSVLMLADLLLVALMTKLCRLSGCCDDRGLALDIPTSIGSESDTPF
jgi:hypothetical protein